MSWIGIQEFPKERMNQLSENEKWIVSSANRNIRSGIIELFEARPILYALVKRELKSRYRGSIFGFTWALGRPLATLLIFYFVIGQVLGASKSIDNFAIYIFVSLMFWNFFAESVIVGTSSIIRSTGLVQKVSFPREILPISTVLLAGVNTLVQLPILILSYVISGQWPNLKGLVILIPILLTLFFLALALALLLSSFNVYIRDIQPLTELAVSLLMYSIPILYSWTFVHDAAIKLSGNLNYFNIYMSNPLVIVLTSIQDALWPSERFFKNGEYAGQFYSIGSMYIWACLIFSLLASLIAYRVFLKLEPNFAREL